ncbi:hypothetical protein Tco_1041653 [Tanacetum coccineum]|uniref:Uncharacterized protein n=1 Tax=Tanacetum coccineum TaxID=301880 RepID=A0ABQ5GHS1_9ASTR
MTLNKYLEYEAKKERRLRKSARSKRNPTIYEEADFNSFHQNKNRAFDYPYYHEDIEIKKYHTSHPLHPCLESALPYSEGGLMSSNTSDEVDIDSMTIAEYESYIAKQGRKIDPLNDHSYSVRIGVKNLRKQEEAKVEKCDEGDIYDIWDITIGDVERLRQLLTPSVHTLHELDLVVQPCVIVLPSLDGIIRSL